MVHINIYIKMQTETIKIILVYFPARLVRGGERKYNALIRHVVAVATH